MDSEKITINIGAIDLGQIDLLVEQGFYANRSDFIRTAIRNQVNVHAAEISHLKVSNAFGLDILDQELKKVDDQIKESLAQVTSGLDTKFAGTGVFSFNKKILEQVKASGNKIEIRMLGMLIVEDDVTPQLAAETFQVVKVFGMIKAPEAVKQVLLGLK